MKSALGLVITAALAGAGCGGGDAKPASTETRVYNPFNASGALVSSLHASDTQSADCFTTSELAERPDAWRCTVGDKLYDPCFASTPTGPGKRVAICPNGAWNDRVLKVESKAPEQAEDLSEPADSAARPWALELADGGKCRLIGGASTIIGRERVNYQCDDKTFLVGEPNRSRKRWTINRSDGDSSSLKATAIAIAWT